MTAVWLPPHLIILGEGWDFESESISKGADDWSNEESPTPSWPSEFFPTEKRKPSPEIKAAW